MILAAATLPWRRIAAQRAARYIANF